MNAVDVLMGMVRAEKRNSESLGCWLWFPGVITSSLVLSGWSSGNIHCVELKPFHAFFCDILIFF